jgi:prevent-host-death family protein
MKLSESVKPVSYVKTHASEILRQVSSEGGGTVVITQNGEAKAVLQGIEEYERTQDSLALLKILALSSRSLEQGRVRPAREAFEEIRNKSRSA